MTEDERQWLAESRRAGTHSVADDAAAQRNLQERGRVVMNSMAGPRDWQFGPDPLIESERTRRMFDINNPPKQLTDTAGLRTDGGFPRLVYHEDGRFQPVANQAELTQARADGFGLEPFPQFDYSHYHQLTERIAVASTHERAHYERHLAGDSRRLVNFVNQERK